MKVANLVIAVLLILSPMQNSRQPAEDFLNREGLSSLAILPPVGESVPGAARQLSADLFGAKLRLHIAAVRVVPPDAVVAELSHYGMTNDFGTFVNLYSQTGTINTDTLKKFGQTLGTDALLLINILNYDEQKGSWWYGKGGKNICRIQYTLFRSATGEKVWETLEFRQHDSKLSTNPYPMERVIGDVSEMAVSSLMAGKQNVDARKKVPN
jgi:hypothetical protein